MAARGTMGYQIIRALLYFFFGLYGLHVEGRENIPDKGAVIAAANHKSYFDPPLVGMALEKRRISFMAKIGAFQKSSLRPTDSISGRLSGEKKQR